VRLSCATSLSTPSPTATGSSSLLASLTSRRGARRADAAPRASETHARYRGIYLYIGSFKPHPRKLYVSSHTPPFTHVEAIARTRHQRVRKRTRGKQRSCFIVVVIYRRLYLYLYSRRRRRRRGAAPARGRGTKGFGNAREVVIYIGDYIYM